MPTRREFPLSLLALLAACGGGDGTEIIEPPPPPMGLDLTLTPAMATDGVDGVLTLAAEVGDAVAAVQFQFDGVDLGAEMTAGPFTRTVDTSRLASGQHVAGARARNAAGQWSEWARHEVRVGGARAVPAGWTMDEAWVGGLNAATAFARAPDGRFFVAEQGGALRVVRDGVLLATPFTTRSVDARGERGLIGVALHPAFAANGRVYVHYTRIDGERRHNRVARLTAAGDVATGPEDAVYDLPTLSGATNHNGGGLAFGEDGMLFVGVGDNADGDLAQDLSVPFGKLLRLDADLGLPADNPRPGNPAWSWGLRNPFTLAVQPGTGRVFVNDVGQNAWEEIDIAQGGDNFGWPLSEGHDRVDSGQLPPYFTYGHAEASPPGSGEGGFFVGAAIAGGAFVPDTDAWPAALRGRYLFADVAAGFVGVLDPQGSGPYQFAQVGGNPVGLCAADDGAVYVLTRSGITRIAPV